MPDASTALRLSLDVRYAGQDGSMPVPVDDLFARGSDDLKTVVKDAFNAVHQRTFGYHDPEQALEVVSVRLAAVARRGDVARSLQASDSAAPARSAEAFALPNTRPVWFEAGDAPIDCLVYQREAMAVDTELIGPAVVQEYASTTLLFPGDRLRIAASGELLIHLREA
jgi:N-methylhydantoinase A